jgi:hypothetical protein
VHAEWGHLDAGALVAADDVAGCNITMLVARGVLQPVLDEPKPKRKPAQPVETADEPEE